MRGSERIIFLVVGLVALAVGFYILVLGPKRDESHKLQDQVNELHASITAAQQQTSYGEQARQDFPKYYGRMVVLGKAVPAQSDTASMLVQLSSLAHQSKMNFKAIALNQGGSGSGSSSSSAAAGGASSPTSPTGAAAAAAQTASTANSATPTSTTGSSASSSAPAAATPAPATEASAASLPIGSVVGPAGLPTLPYTVKLDGGFFDVGNFIGGIDGLVKPVSGGSQLSPDGRLLTVNGFSLMIKDAGPPPLLKASFIVTAYSTGDTGLTAGATPSGPAPTSPGAAQVQPASAVVAK